jgi:Xaa-Pro aminopeptidase
MARLVLDGCRVLYTPASPAEGRAGSRDELLRAAGARAADPWDGLTSREGRFGERLRACFPQLELRDLSPILDGLRAVKRPKEIERLRLAGRLSALGITEAMRSTQPGIFEYELAAVASFLFASGGASDEGYRPIVAGGSNIWFPHYHRNDAPLREGDLVLMDYAPDVGYYTSDIGRMWPVSGTYAPWQRALYGFVADYQRVLLATIHPGMLAGDILLKASERMRPRLAAARFERETHRAAAERLLEYPGNLSHPVGMAVHDAGGYGEVPLQPGTVFSVDPQLWVPEERLYIRVEDTVVVTQDGVENLTQIAPLDLDDVEQVMKEEGLLQGFRRRKATLRDR